MPPASTTEAVRSDATASLPDACPIVAASATRTSPDSAAAPDRLEQLLTEFEIPHDVKVYAGVGHDFMNDHDPADQTLMLLFLARTLGHEVRRGRYP